MKAPRETGRVSLELNLLDANYSLTLSKQGGDVLFFV